VLTSFINVNPAASTLVLARHGYGQVNGKDMNTKRLRYALIMLATSAAATGGMDTAIGRPQSTRPIIYAVSDNGWTFENLNSSAAVYWIKKDTIKGPLDDRQVELMDADPGRRPGKGPLIQHSVVHIDCPKGKLYRRSFSSPSTRNETVSIPALSIWEGIAEKICPSGTYKAGLSR
jgi:hypothetical protein